MSSFHLSILSSLKRGIFLMVALFVLLLGTTVAAEASVATLSYGFPTQDKELVAGMAVASVGEPGDQQAPFVTRATSDDINQYVGVVTAIEQPTSQSASAQAFITQTGQAEVYASTLNGAIKKGDYIALSPLKGVLMRGSSGEQKVLGTAMSDFSSTGAAQSQITGVNGEAQTVEVNKILANLNFPTLPPKASRSFLVSVGSAIVGKEVSQARVVAAALLIAFLLIVEGAIIYGAVRSSIIALGRNPLSKKVVYKELLNVSLLVLIVLAAGLGVTYLILWF